MLQVTYSVLLCLGILAKLKIWPGTHKWPGTAPKETNSITVTLKMGDIILFRTDLIHCGCAYDAGEFIRVHSYVDVGSVKSPEGGSFIIVTKEEQKFLTGARDLNDRDQV